MAVGLSEIVSLTPVAGVRWASTAAGIGKQGRDDLALMELAAGSTAAGMFTRNAFCAAPVQIARAHLAKASPRLLLINAGNANAGTGGTGVDAAQACCDAAGALAGCGAEQVLPFSTGVIGEPLPVDKIRRALPGLYESLTSDGWLAAARAIMTTDTVAKGAERRIELAQGPANVVGIAKGSGMIRPDMATMLAFIATDAAVPQTLLQETLSRAVQDSFNRITVDGDTSTNDACMLAATAAGSASIEQRGGDWEALTGAVSEVCSDLARAIIRDGEGATKFVTIEVHGGRSRTECLQVAYTVAHSPLVKTALFASDPNWGRILAAVGRAQVEGLDVDQVTIRLNDLCIVRGGGRAPSYSEEAGQRAMAGPEITIGIDLARGDAYERVWTSDLSHDYIRINAEYRT